MRTKRSAGWWQRAVERCAGRAEALAAWASVFRHPYWDALYEDEIAAAKAQGEALRFATQVGSLYTTAAGTIKFTKPSEAAVPVRPHRFYGES